MSLTFNPIGSSFSYSTSFDSGAEVGEFGEAEGVEPSEKLLVFINWVTISKDRIFSYLLLRDPI